MRSAKISTVDSPKATWLRQIEEAAEALRKKIGPSLSVVSEEEPDERSRAASIVLHHVTQALPLLESNVSRERAALVHQLAPSGAFARDAYEQLDDPAVVQAINYQALQNARRSVDTDPAQAAILALSGRDARFNAAMKVLGVHPNAIADNLVDGLRLAISEAAEAFHQPHPK